MDQIPRRFSTDHVRNLLRGYTEGLLERPAIEETLGITKSRFFALLRVLVIGISFFARPRSRIRSRLKIPSCPREYGYMSVRELSR